MVVYVCDRCGVKVNSTSLLYSGSFINQTGSDVKKFGGQVCQDCMDTIINYGAAKAQAVREGADVVSFTTIPITSIPISPVQEEPAPTVDPVPVQEESPVDPPVEEVIG